MISVSYNNFMEGEYNTLAEAKNAILEQFSIGEILPNYIQDEETDVIYGCEWDLELVII